MPLTTRPAADTQEIEGADSQAFAPEEADIEELLSQKILSSCSAPLSDAHARK
jgi:hypothetical protein